MEAVCRGSFFIVLEQRKSQIKALMKYIGKCVREVGYSQAIRPQMLSESILSSLIGGECGFDKLICFKVLKNWFIWMLGLTQRWPNIA